MYFSLPHFASGGGNKQVFENMWNENMAGDVSKQLPGVRVEGSRTFAIPLERLIPGILNRNDTSPDGPVAARSATFVNGKAVED